MYRKILIVAMMAATFIFPAALTIAAPVADVPAYENPTLANAPNKDAVLVVSRGATDKTIREQSILSVTAAIKKVAPKRKVITAFTDRTVIGRIKAKENTVYQTPGEALTQLAAEGYTRVAVVPLALIADEEYERCKKICEIGKDKFKRLTCALPLMYSQEQDEVAGDVQTTINAVSGQFPRQQKKEALLLTASGTDKPSQTCFLRMQSKFDDAGYTKVFVSTLNGNPTLDTVIGKMKAAKVKSVVLIPFMLTTKDDGAEDVIGDGDQTQNAKLTAAGFTVSIYSHGLGENAAVRNLFVRRADEAWAALRKTQKKP